MSHVVLISLSNLRAFFEESFVDTSARKAMGQCCVLERDFFVQSVNQPEIKEQNGITKSAKMR